MGRKIGYIGHIFIVWALSYQVAFAQGEDDTLLQDNRHYTYIYWENGYPTREAQSRRPQSWANSYARENPDLVIQTGYYSLVLDGKTMQLDGYDALTGSDYVSALHQDVTQFTPASLTLKAYQDGIEYTATSGLVQNGSDAPVRLIESGQFLQRYDHLGIEFTAADGTKLDVEGRLEISAWPEHVVFKLDFSNLEDTAINIDRTLIQLTSPAGKSFTSDVNSISTTLSVRPHEDLENAPLNADSIVTVATNLQNNNALVVAFDTDLHALKVNLPINGVRYPDHIDRVDEFLIEVSNTTTNSLDIPLVFEENTPRAITGTVMLLTDADDGKPTGIPIQISKNWHVGSDTGVKAIHRGSWLRGSTYFTLPAGTTKRFKLKVVFGYWASVGAASHSQLSLVGWGGNWKWDESAVGAWGESMTYDPTQHLGSSFMADIRPTFTPSMSDGGDHNWTENVGGGDFLTYFDANNQYRWGKRLKTAYVWTGPNMTQVMYSGITDDDKIRFEYVSKLVSTNDYHRRIHNYRYQFLEDVADPNRLVFYQMAADYYLGPDFDTYYVGDSTGLLQESTSEPGGNAYKDGKFSFLDRWLASDDLVALDQNTAKATRGIIQRSSTLNGNDFPVFMHKYGRSWGSDKMLFDLAGESVEQSYSAGDVVEGEVEFILPAKQKENYWGADTEFAARLDTYTKPWESVFDEYRYNNKLSVTVHKGTLLNNFPVEIMADQNGPSVIADISIQAGGLGHVPVVINDAVIGKSLNVERYLNGDWVPLEVNAATSNSYYQGYQNAKGKIDYAFSIKRPADDLATAWRIRVSYDEPIDSDGDDDSSSNLDEFQVPNASGNATGDGNGDSIADSQQAHVTSLASATGNSWLSYTNAASGSQSGFITSAAAPVDIPANYHLPLGTVHYEIASSAGAAVVITVYVTRNDAIQDYLLLGNDGQWHSQSAAVLHIDNKTRLTFSVTEGGNFDRDATANGALQRAKGGVMVTSGLAVSPYAYRFGQVELHTRSTTKTFTVQNSGSRPLLMQSSSLEGTHSNEFEIITDNCSGQTLADSAQCTLEAAFHPSSIGSKSALLNITTDDPDETKVAIFLSNHEAPEEEAARRLPPVLSNFAIKDTLGETVSTLQADTSYTIEWSILGYHQEYQSQIAMFNCTSITDDTSCGASYSDQSRFMASGALSTHQAPTDGTWRYGDVDSQEHQYRHTFTTPGFTQETPIVIRFYRRNHRDQLAGKESLSLIIPGNHAENYYDTTGRRLKNTISPP